MARKAGDYKRGRRLAKQARNRHAIWVDSWEKYKFIGLARWYRRMERASEDPDKAIQLAREILRATPHIEGVTAWDKKERKVVYKERR